MNQWTKGRIDINEVNESVNEVNDTIDVNEVNEVQWNRWAECNERKMEQPRQKRWIDNMNRIKWLGQV